MVNLEKILHYEELAGLYRSPSTVMTVKSGRLKWDR